MTSNKGRLAGRVAVITGAGAGIGCAAAGIFAREGATVVIAEIDEQTGPRAAERIKASGGDALYVRTDATDEGSVAALFGALGERHGLPRPCGYVRAVPFGQADVGEVHDQHALTIPRRAWPGHRRFPAAGISGRGGRTRPGR
jgi:NAD(P)-dependent dehydrogenase (short-subunit alcohol dehydrogenase family)